MTTEDDLRTELQLVRSERDYLLGKVEIYEAALAGALGALSLRSGPAGGERAERTKSTPRDKAQRSAEGVERVTMRPRSPARLARVTGRRTAARAKAAESGSTRRGPVG